MSNHHKFKNFRHVVAISLMILILIVSTCLLMRLIIVTKYKNFFPPKIGFWKPFYFLQTILLLCKNFETTH